MESSYELYDLKKDPEELNNVAKENEDVLNKLKNELSEWVGVMEKG